MKKASFGKLFLFLLMAAFFFTSCKRKNVCFMNLKKMKESTVAQVKYILIMTERNTSGRNRIVTLL